MKENTAKKKTKILAIAPKTGSLINFRGDLLCDMKKKNCDIVVVVPEDESRDFFKQNDIKVRLIELDKNSLSVFGTINYYRSLKRIIKEEKPDKVFSYTIKPVIFGSVAAKKSGVKDIYSLICGLGILFCSDSWKIKLLRPLVGVMYKRALKYNKKVIFQNQDDIDEFVSRGYVDKSKCELVNGSGVNLKKFKRNKIPTDYVGFLMVSRVLKEKGVMEYFKAAKMVKEKYPKTSFSFIGMIDKHKNALDFNELESYIKEGIVEYVPETNEVERYVADCSVFVLPTYYREGIPRTLLEALAMGRPVLTTKTPGCKETVVDGKNGFFVKERQVDDLVKKMIWMIENKSKLQKMGDESYKTCLKKFTIEKIDADMIKIVGIA